MKVTLADIEKALKVIAPYIHRTFLELSENASSVAGANVFLKFENLQRTGSFKIRGAANKLSSLSDKEKTAGVIAASAGNHAQGVACMAQKLGIKAVIVMPELSPLIKVLSTKRFGAEVILHGASFDEAYLHAQKLQAERGYVFIHPFEDERIIAGQGTLGLELFQDCPQADAVFIPIGGGGVLSGTATALKALNPKVKIIGIQSAAASSMAQSFQKGQLIVAKQQAATIADGIAVKHPSQVMYADFISKLCDDVVTVTDDEIAQTIVFLMERAKTVVDGAGAVGLAAILNKKSKLKFENAVAVLTGGNIDLNLIERIIDRGLQKEGRIARILVSIPDLPGALTKLTALIADKRANVIDINHSRVSNSLELRETLVEFVLETTGEAQVRDLIEGFKRLGAKILG